MEYRIGVKRRFFFGFKNYLVVGHKTEILGDSARLILRFLDGTILTVPRIDMKAVKIYAEFQRIEQVKQPDPSVE